MRGPDDEHRGGSRATQRFEQELEVLRSVVDGMPTALIVVDHNGRFLYFNEAAVQILGLGSLEIDPRQRSQEYGLYEPDNHAEIPADELPLARALRGESVTDRDILVRNRLRPEGVFIKVDSRPLLDKTGEVVGGVATFRDVTAKRRSEKLVKRLSTAIERTGDGVMITDPQGYISYVNRAFERRTGYRRREVIGETPALLKSGEHDPKFYRHMWKTILGGQEFRGTVLNKKKSGELFWSELTITPIVGEQGRPAQFVSVLKNITQREAQLRRERDFNAAVLTSTGALILVTDPQFRVIRFNPVCESVSGYTESKLKGESLVDLTLLEQDLDGWRAAFQELQHGNRPAPRELQWTVHDGSTRTIRWSFRGIRDDAGNLGHVVASGIDVTESKRHEEALRAARDELEHRVEERTAELRDALDEVHRLTERLEAENVLLREEVKRVLPDVEIVGNAPATQSVVEQVRRVAPTGSSVLLMGETGTGKGLFARAIHAWSPVADKPLVTVDCGALPANLIESELFGHERGAFTGADRERPGRFEMADGGTLFLDEIGDMPLDLQTRLLRVLQSGEFERVGSARTRTVRTRVIAATNRDLKRMVDRREFRADLYFRLSVFPIVIPPLRERREDIPALVRHFLERLGLDRREEPVEISSAVLDLLQSHDWPGNVRELSNTLERALITSTGGRIAPDEIRAYLDGFPQRRQISKQASRQTLQDHERSYIIEVLERCGWRIKGSGNAAERLGVPASTLRDRMKKLSIDRRGRIGSKREVSRRPPTGGAGGR